MKIMEEQKFEMIEPYWNTSHQKKKVSMQMNFMK